MLASSSYSSSPSELTPSGTPVLLIGDQQIKDAWQKLAAALQNTAHGCDIRSYLGARTTHDAVYAVGAARAQCTNENWEPRIVFLSIMSQEWRGHAERLNGSYWQWLYRRYIKDTDIAGTCVRAMGAVKNAGEVFPHAHIVLVRPLVALPTNMFGRWVDETLERHIGQCLGWVPTSNGGRSTILWCDERSSLFATGISSRLALTDSGTSDLAMSIGNAISLLAVTHPQRDRDPLASDPQERDSSVVKDALA